MPEDSAQQQIGQLAVERGLVTVAHLTEAIREHERRRAAGSEVPLGEVLIELELLSRRQLESLLTSQGKPSQKKQAIAGYELIKRLGEGGMGATYLARQTSMDRLVALKVLRKNLAKNTDFVDRFVREARLAGKLNHVNIVQSQDVGESGGFHYLVMEYVEGRSAYSLMPKGGMDEELALHICMQVARALDFGHRNGIVHRDIKPDNIIVTEDRIAKLCDFGLARDTAQETRLTQTGMMMGTPHYVSPEQARGEKDVDIRSDIYSLGATLYHLVTGETPFRGSSPAVVMTKHLTSQMPWPQDVNPLVSDGCCRLIARMMAKDPNDRYLTPEELLRDMELVIDGKPPGSAVLDPMLSSIAGSGAVPAADITGETIPLAPPKPRAEPGEFPAVEGMSWAEDAEPAAASQELTGHLPGARPADWEEIAKAAAAEAEPSEPPEGIFQYGKTFKAAEDYRKASMAEDEEGEAEPPRRQERQEEQIAQGQEPAAEEEAPVGDMDRKPPAEPVDRSVSPERTRRRRRGTRGTRPLRAVEKRGRPVKVYAALGAVLVFVVVAVAVLLALKGGEDGDERLAPPPIKNGKNGKVATPGPARFRAEWKELKFSGETPRNRGAIATALAYDSKRKRCILAGGHIGYGSTNDLWALDVQSAKWTCLEKHALKNFKPVGARPAGMMDHHVVYDAATDRYVTPTYSYDPDARRWIKGGHKAGRSALAYYPDARKYLRIWKPSRGNTRVDLFDINTGLGTQSSKPGFPHRDYCWGGLAYDQRSKVFVLFGGSNYKPEKAFNDTWTFNPKTKTWRGMKPPVSPSARGRHKLVWHEGLGALVMAGGSPVYKKYFNDLWVYEADKDRWTEVKTAIAPPPAHAATVYDTAHDRLVLFNQKGQTWTCKIERVKK